MRSDAASRRPAVAWQWFGLGLFVAYPFTAHSASPAAAVALLAALLGFVLASLYVRHAVRWLVPPLAASCLYFAHAAWLLYVPPVAINLALCWLFGRTLVRGRTPLIARFAMMEQGTLSAELAAYTRVLTWIWTLLFAAAAAVSVLLALSGHRDAWSIFTNFIDYLLVAALFLGEFAYRKLRFRSYRHQSPLQLLRNVRRAGLFER